MNSPQLRYTSSLVSFGVWPFRCSWWIRVFNISSFEQVLIIFNYLVT